MEKCVDFNWLFEIGGFGCDYVDACHGVTEGVNWIRNHPDEVDAWNFAEEKWKKDNPDKKFMPASAYPDSRMKFGHALNAISRLKYELKNKGLEKDICEAREQIEELRKSLFDMENSMTKLYEDAAEAMNFLEEPGYQHEELKNDKQKEN